MTLLAGEKLGPYEILIPLGAGGMGEVYKARDTRLNRLVAIKVLPAERVADEGRKRRFIQGAQAASALNHSNIITIHDIASDHGRDYIVMEYVPGKTLDALIPRSGMRLGELLERIEGHWLRGYAVEVDVGNQPRDYLVSALLAKSGSQPVNMRNKSTI